MSADLLFGLGKFIIGVLVVYDSLLVLFVRLSEIAFKALSVILLRPSTARDLSICNILVSPVIPDHYRWKVEENKHVVL
jgi:hypothetical protein